MNNQYNLVPVILLIALLLLFGAILLIRRGSYTAMTVETEETASPSRSGFITQLVVLACYWLAIDEDRVSTYMSDDLNSTFVIIQMLDGTAQIEVNWARRRMYMHYSLQNRESGTLDTVDCKAKYKHWALPESQLIEFFKEIRATDIGLRRNYRELLADLATEAAVLQEKGDIKDPLQTRINILTLLAAHIMQDDQVTPALAAAYIQFFALNLHDYPDFVEQLKQSVTFLADEEKTETESH